MYEGDQKHHGSHRSPEQYHPL